MQNELVSKEKMGRLIGVKPGTVGRWSREGKIPRIVISPKIIRFDPEAVLLALRQKGGGNER